MADQTIQVHVMGPDDAVAGTVEQARRALHIVTIASGLPTPGRAMTRIALYGRVSTRDKDQNPETQLRPLREHAGLQDDAEVVGEFVDKASADDLRGRRRWRELLELARRRQVDPIVVWRLDRAFHSVLDGATTLGHLRTWGCGLCSLREPWIDTTTPIGEAMFHITIAWASLAIRTLTERTRAGMERAARRASGAAAHAGGRSSGIPRFPRLRDLVQAGVLTRAEGARRLRVRYETFADALSETGSQAADDGVA